MDQSRFLQSLKRAKPVLSTIFHGLSEASNTTSTELIRSYQIILQVFLKDPWVDYDYICDIDQVKLARNKSSYFKLVNIRYSSTCTTLEQVKTISALQHTNIVTIAQVYCYNGIMYFVADSLGICISRLGYQEYHLEEWELATIIKEVQDTLFYIYRSLTALGSSWYTLYCLV